MILSTLAAPARFELIARKSRFLAQAITLDRAELASAFLDSVREADASHNCWAYRIGSTYRSSDEGEPAGTAGRPILAAIDGQHCDRVMVVVARWFGGIKLGAGGLEHVGTVHQLIAQFGAVKRAETFTDDGLQFDIQLLRERMQALQSALRDATRGQVRIVEAIE